MEKTIFYSILIITLCCFSCKNKEDTNPTQNTCEKTAFFYGTEVCANTGIAIQVEEPEGLTIYIATNFEDFANSADFTFEEEMTVEFEITDYPPLGLLCGPLIVAPSIELSCLEEI